MTDIDPGSPSGRIATLLWAKPKHRFDRAAIAETLQIAPAAVDKALQPGVEAGLITVAHDGDLGRVWSPGRLIKDWPDQATKVSQDKKTANSAATAPRRAASDAAHRRLPPLAIGSLAVSAATPLPDGRTFAKGKTRYDAIFELLTADGMSITSIPLAYYGSVLKATQGYLKARPELAKLSLLLVRKVNADTCGVWRIQRAGYKS